MSDYRIRATGAVVSEAELRAAHPDSVLPSPLTPDALEFAGADPVLEAPAPAVTATQTVARNGVTQDAGGNWVTAWTVTDMSAGQVAAALAAAKASQTAVVSAACQSAIVAGFSSSALGTAHTYPAKPTDQQNLNASVVASILPGVAADWTTPFWCADGSGAWAYVMHTAAQIQQVGQDGKAAILACLTKNQQLAMQIDAATTVEAVKAITWS
jgi:hypothetical protein